MLLSTERLVEAVDQYRLMTDQMGVDALDPTIRAELQKPVLRELNELGSYVFRVSSLVVVAGLENRTDISGVAIDQPPAFIGRNPNLQPVVYPESPLEDLDLVPSLVFWTYLPEQSMHDEELVDVSCNFPFAALPLTEPHSLEAIAYGSFDVDRRPS